MQGVTITRETALKRATIAFATKPTTTITGEDRALSKCEICQCEAVVKMITTNVACLWPEVHNFDEVAVFV